MNNHVLDWGLEIEENHPLLAAGNLETNLCLHLQWPAGKVFEGPTLHPALDNHIDFLNICLS